MMRNTVIYIFIMAFVWWCLTSGDVSSWLVGIPVIVMAAILQYRLMPGDKYRYSIRGVLRYLPYFARHALNGGLDVAYRAFAPRLPVDPGFVNYKLRLPPGPWRVFFVNSISLLPGTLSCQLGKDRVEVHVLSQRSSTIDELKTLEEKVAEVFGLEGELTA